MDYTIKMNHTIEDVKMLTGVKLNERINEWTQLTEQGERLECLKNKIKTIQEILWAQPDTNISNRLELLLAHIKLFQGANLTSTEKAETIHLLDRVFSDILYELFENDLAYAIFNA